MPGLTDQGALREVYRFGFLAETGLRGTGGLGAVVNPKGYENVTCRFGRAKREDKRQMNSRRATYRTRPGEKSFELRGKLQVNENFYADWKGPLASCLGKELAASTLVLSGGTGTVNGATLTSGTPDPIVRVGLSNGLFYIVPLKSFNSGTGAIVWGYTLPALGGATITSVQNANQRAGGCFIETLDAPTTFTVEVDQGAEPDQVPCIGQGCIPEMSVDFKTEDGEGRLGVDFGFTGVDWNQTQGANVADPGLWTQDFVPYFVDVAVQSITTPALLTQRLAVEASFKLSPEWRMMRAAQSRLSTGANPGSAVYNIKRAAPLLEDIELSLGISAAAEVTARTNHGTSNMVYLCFYDGDPSATGTRALAFHWRETHRNDDPETADVGGINGQKIRMKSEDPTDVDAIGNFKTRLAVAAFMN